MLDIKYFLEIEKSIKGLRTDEALPILQNMLWKIAAIYNVEGSEVFIQYMNWKSKQKPVT